MEPEKIVTTAPNTTAVVTPLEYWMAMAEVTPPATTAWMAVMTRANDTAARRRSGSNRARTTSRLRTHGAEACDTVPHTRRRADAEPTTANTCLGNSQTRIRV